MLGAGEVSRIMLGSELIWERNATPTPIPIFNADLKSYTLGSTTIANIGSDTDSVSCFNVDTGSYSLTDNVKPADNGVYLNGWGKIYINTNLFRRTTPWTAETVWNGISMPSKQYVRIFSNSADQFEFYFDTYSNMLNLTFIKPSGSVEILMSGAYTSNSRTVQIPSVTKDVLANKFSLKMVNDGEYVTAKFNGESIARMQTNVFAQNNTNEQIAVGNYDFWTSAASPVGTISSFKGYDEVI
jgi:hypothetical protein